MDLDLNLVRNRKNKDVALYLRRLLAKHPATSICQALLSAVDSEELTPEIFSIFLSCAKSVECIASCLRQTSSKQTRRIAIKHYGKVLEDSVRWRTAWNIMGGTSGMAAFMSSISIRDLKFLISRIGSCNRGETRSHQREQAMEELFETVCSAQKPHSRGTDARPIQKYYLKLLPACSSTFVLEWLQKLHESRSEDYCLKRLLRSHGTTIQRLTESMFYDGKWDGKWERLDRMSWFPAALKQFALREPSHMGDEPRFSASMSFSLRILQWRLKHPPDSAWTTRTQELDILNSLFQRCRSKHVSQRRLHDIVVLSLEFLKLSARSKSHSVFGLIWTFTAERWRKVPEKWQDVLISALSLGLGGSESCLAADFVRFPGLANLDNTKRWELFRLFTLHIPSRGIDINVTRNLGQLKQQQWPPEIFDQFERRISARLLQELIHANTSYSFLPIGPGQTILYKQQISGHANFNALLLMWSLQSRSDDKNLCAESKKATEAATTEFQQKSAASREQVERAQYAELALLVAIASSSLDLYAQIVTWIGRFVRDPLTVKQLFHPRIVETEEGIDLLTGIPSPSMTTKVDLADVNVRVGKANAVLQTFHKHMQLAKREPSFHKPDWQAVHSLFGAVIDARIDLAQSLQNHLSATDGEMYSAVWSQSLEVLSEIGSESLGRAQPQVAALINTLSPQILLTTTRALLDTDDMYRARAKEGDAGQESRIIENLAYQGLIELARSDKPKLAQELIIHTIINRPDASSWHRRLLSVGYLKTLPAKDAEDLLLAFANAIGEKLQEQSYVRIGEAPGKPSLVKVTTVKYLAQLLENADFISAEATVDVLVELFKSATHPDIRIATFESLMSILVTKVKGGAEFDARNYKARDLLMEKILIAFESIIPVVGSINERRPPTDQDWQEAEADPQKLPEVHQELLHVFRTPDLLSLVLEATTYRQDDTALRDLKCAILNRVLLPIVKRSAIEHDRWIRLFLRKHAPDLVNKDILSRCPSIPLTPRLTERMVQGIPRDLPVLETNRLDQYARFLLTLPPSLTHLNERFKNDASKRTQTDVQHWLTLFDEGREYTLQNTTRIFLHLLHDRRLGPDDSTVWVERYQKIVVSHMEILLADYDNHVKLWNDLVEALRPPTINLYAELPQWQANQSPVLEDSVRMVEAARSKAWLENPKRKPAVLPRTSRMTLWLKIGPYLRRKSTDGPVDDCEVIADEITAWVETQVMTGTVRPERLASDTYSLEPCLSHIEQVTIGCCLAAACDRTNTPGHTEDEVLTLVTAARSFIENGWQVIDPDKDGGKRKEHDALVDRVRKARHIWLRSEFESVREVAFEMKGKGPKANLWQ